MYSSSLIVEQEGSPNPTANFTTISGQSVLLCDLYLPISENLNAYLMTL